MQPAPRRRGFVRRLLGAAGRLITGRQPELYEPPQYPTTPPDYGDYIDYDLPDDTVPEDEGDYYEEEPWEPEIDLRDANNQYIGSHTKEEWFQEVLKPKEELLFEYGYDNLDIIGALVAAGYWDDEDWRTWRELYPG